MPNNQLGPNRITQNRVGTPTVGVGLAPSWLGNALADPTVVGILPEASFSASGRGRFSLTTATRFPRGPRMSGRRGTIDLLVRIGTQGVASTLCYLTDDPSNPDQALVLGLDASNRPTLHLATVVTPALATATGVLTLSGNVTDTAATGQLSSSAQVNDGDTVTIDAKVYTFQASLTDVDGNVQIGGTQALSMENLRRAINLDGVAGTNYATSMTLHPTVSATDTATTVDVTAKVKGEEANTIATTATGVILSWGNTTLTGGANDKVTIGAKTYKFQTALTNVDGNVLIGATASDSIDNLIAAINLAAGGGSTYAAATTLHPTVSAAAGTGDTMDATAKVAGEFPNNIATTDTGATTSWGAGTLTGGIGGPVPVAELTPSGLARDDSIQVRIRMAWDTAVPVLGTRYASLRVNGELVDSGDWSVDPTTAWAHFAPTHLVLGAGHGLAADFDGDILLCQCSETVTP